MWIVFDSRPHSTTRTAATNPFTICRSQRAGVPVTMPTSTYQQCLVLDSTTRRQMRHLKIKRRCKHCLAVAVYSTVNITGGSNCQRSLINRSLHDQILTCGTIRITFKTSNNDSVETAQDSGGTNAHTEVWKLAFNSTVSDKAYTVCMHVCMYVCMYVCTYDAPFRRVRVTIVAVGKQQLTNSRCMYVCILALSHPAYN